MHELPVTENILDIVLRYANQAGAEKVVTIYLVIGQFSSIIDNSIQFYWEIIAKDTIAEGANLEFKRIAGQFRCNNCQLAFSPRDDTYACPSCGSTKIEIIAGNEFFIEAIEIDQPNQVNP